VLVNALPMSPGANYATPWAVTTLALLREPEGKRRGMGATLADEQARACIVVP
jgi:hypothetical protein